jgi:flagellar assembly protein FliH
MSDAMVKRWEFAPLAGRGGSAAADLDSRRRQASEDGYQAGYRAGMAAAQGIAQRLGGLLSSSEQGLRLLEERLAGELVDLAVELARHVVRVEIAARREAIVPLAREALALLAQDARSVQIVVHPTDAALLQRSLSEDIARSGWRIVEDARVEPGGVRVVSSTGDVDATLATRWRRVLSALGQDRPWHEPGE